MNSNTEINLFVLDIKKILSFFFRGGSMEGGLDKHTEGHKTVGLKYQMVNPFCKVVNKTFSYEA